MFYLIRENQHDFKDQTEKIITAVNLILYAVACISVDNEKLLAILTALIVGGLGIGLVSSTPDALARLAAN